MALIVPCWGESGWLELQGCTVVPAGIASPVGIEIRVGVEVAVAPSGTATAAENPAGILVNSLAEAAAWGRMSNGAVAAAAERTWWLELKQWTSL
jgi:hypothetical protein